MDIITEVLFRQPYCRDLISVVLMPWVDAMTLSLHSVSPWKCVLHSFMLWSLPSFFILYSLHNISSRGSEFRDPAMLDGNVLSTAVKFLMFRACRTQKLSQCLAHDTITQRLWFPEYLCPLYSWACLLVFRKRNVNIFYYVTGELLLYLDSFSFTYIWFFFC